MLGRKDQPAPTGPAHERNAAAARELVNRRDPAVVGAEKRELELLKANALATLALCELLRGRGD
jgi:hypothetical protein